MDNFDELKNLLSGITENKGPELEQLNQFAQSLAGLEHAVTDLSHSHIRIGYSMELCRLLCSMIGRILVENDIITKEKFQERYENEVLDELRKQQELLKQKMDEASKYEEKAKEETTKEVQSETMERKDSEG